METRRYRQDPSGYSSDVDTSFAPLLGAKQLERLEFTTPSHSPARSRKASVLSISSLFPDISLRADDITASTINIDELLQSPLKRPVGPQDVVHDACADITRELDAVEARLGLYRYARLHQQQQSSRPPLYDNALDQASASATMDPMPPVLAKSSSSAQQQHAGEVADEVENALLTCDRLLSKAKASVTNSLQLSRSAASSRVEGSSVPSVAMPSRVHMKELPGTMQHHVSSIPDDETRLEKSMTDRPVAPSSTYIPVKGSPSPPPSPPILESSSSMHTPVNAFDVPSAEERDLAAKAMAMKTLAVRCQREVEEAATTTQQRQSVLQSAFLKELQRKYESKKKTAILMLKETYERETKNLVQGTMEKYERDHAQVLSRLEEELRRDRERTMNDVIAQQERMLEDRVKRLEARLSVETLAKKRQLESQFQSDLHEKLKALEAESEEDMRSWETQKRLDLEHEVFKRREEAAMTILRKQELQTSKLKQEIEQQHAENEQAELDKLRKALAFGAQAQLQQLRKKLDSEHEDRISETKANAARSLEFKLMELKQVLHRTHEDEHEKLKRELDKRHRIAVVELQESLQAEHHAQILEIKKKADKERDAALEVCRNNAFEEHQQQRQEFEKTLEMELRMKTHQMEIEQEESYSQLLDDLQGKLIQNHQRELDARIARMEEAKTILMAEVESCLSLERHPADHDVASPRPEASHQLNQLKRRVSSELTKYIEILVTDFDGMTEEQRILVTKITDLTQLYFSFKRRCGKLETESTELKSTLQMLHSQLQDKELMCKKLYQANEALLQRLQVAPSPKKASRC